MDGDLILGPAPARKMIGRTVIYSNARQVTRENLLSVLQKAYATHLKNRGEIDYLYKYYKGDQPVLHRVKNVRPEICNKIVENRANEIVSFKVGYLCGEPIQYVGQSGDQRITEEVAKLNNLMFSEDKPAQDQEIVEWDMICGTAFRMVLPDSEDEEENDESPFELYTLDPRNTFVVYSSAIGHHPLMGVTYYVDENNESRYSIYTKNEYFEVVGEEIVEETAHMLGMIPIIEYPANSSRLGSFEIVLPLLDAINNVESNRMDGMEQTIQAFIKFVNCDITADDFKELKEMGAIKVKSVDGANADVDVVTNDLNQDQSQTLKDDYYQAVLTICGMPNRNGGTSTSDTGAAVVLRDGWSLAEARAKDSENIFKRSEKQMLKLVLKICRDLTGMDLKLSEISLKFTRRNYENIQTKAQVLTQMLDNDKVHPLTAYKSSGLFTDPEAEYILGMAWYQEQQAKEPVETEVEDSSDAQQGI